MLNLWRLLGRPAKIRFGLACSYLPLPARRVSPCLACPAGF
jgi:hypothetical protein